MVQSKSTRTKIFNQDQSVSAIKSKGAKAQKGVLCKLRSLITHTSIGELLVRTGTISPVEMRRLLKLQKTSGGRLGRLAVQQGYVSPTRLFIILCEQRTIRFAAAFLAMFVSLLMMKSTKARAGVIKDVPALLEVSHTPNYDKFAYLQSFPKLFNMKEVKSTNIKPFEKWTGMFNKFTRQIKDQNSEYELTKLRESILQMADLPDVQMVREVNKWANSVEYVEDASNWNKSDYWATPVEFFRKGGDCEDYAIAKYVALRALGWPENRLRIAIVTDLIKGIPHAVLIVYTDEGPMLLDNQIKQVKFTEDVFRYKPIFSINRHAWWYHKDIREPEAVIASVQ